MTSNPRTERVSAPRITVSGDSRLSTAARARVIAIVLWGNLLCQMGIIVTGGVVRLTGSGLGCSTWPHCEPGRFTPVLSPEMGIHPLIEFGNRTLTGVLGVFSIAVLVVAMLWLRHKGTAFLLLAMVPLVGTIVQALIGALVVWMDLHPGVVSPHFLISPILVAFSVVLLYRARTPGDRMRLAIPRGDFFMVLALGGIAFTILILGTLVTGTGPHSGDSSNVTRLAFDPVMISRVHALSVWAFCILLAVILVRLVRARAPRRALRAGFVLAVLTVAQGAIGYIQYFTGLPELIVGMHLAGAALFAAAMTWFAVSAFDGAESTAALADAPKPAAEAVR